MRSLESSPVVILGGEISVWGVATYVSAYGRGLLRIRGIAQATENEICSSTANLAIARSYSLRPERSAITGLGADFCLLLVLKHAVLAPFL